MEEKSVCEILTISHRWRIAGIKLFALITRSAVVEQDKVAGRFFGEKGGSRGTRQGGRNRRPTDTAWPPWGWSGGPGAGWAWSPACRGSPHRATAGPAVAFVAGPHRCAHNAWTLDNVHSQSITAGSSHETLSVVGVPQLHRQ